MQKEKIHVKKTKQIKAVENVLSSRQQDITLENISVGSDFNAYLKSKFGRIGI